MAEWINTSKRGDAVEYYRGDLAFDAHHDKSGYLGSLKGMFWRAYEAGLVTLVQRRNGASDFSYIAQRL